MRILTKDTALEKDFDFLEHHKDRVLVGLTLTATNDKSEVMAVIEPKASTNIDRMCKRPDCAAHFAHTTNHNRLHCSQYCAHIQSVRRDRKKGKRG